MEAEVIVSILRTADHVRRRIGDLLDGYELTPQQYNVLRILRGAGPEGLPTLEIADRMIERAPGITRLLDRLEAKGLVRRRRCASDRRQVLCTISARGRRIVDSLDLPVHEASHASLAHMNPDALRTLSELLDTVRSDETRADTPERISAR